MGGTGTLAFLLGTAHALDDGRFVVSHLHLPSPAHERPMLEWLADRLTRATVLLSFNGKSFDWPLLRARFVMNRLPPPPELPHVDLLHCARRVFRHHLDELTLGSLERRVLDVHRRGDIEGAQIPPAWFDFLRTGRVATLGRVLSHNERDVRSMVDLVQRLIAAWEERHPLLPPTALGLAQVAMREPGLESARRSAPSKRPLGRGGRSAAPRARGERRPGAVAPAAGDSLRAPTARRGRRDETRRAGNASRREGPLAPSAARAKASGAGTHGGHALRRH
jgi:hypothetical protein